MTTIQIRTDRCIRCGHCARVCPSGIFVQPAPKADIELHNIESCIVCGHCAGVCPTDAVDHADFPPERVHPIDRKALPSPESLMLLMRSRRSNRAFSREVIPSGKLTLILEAAHRAPTASNAQQVRFTLVTDPAKVDLIRTYTIDTFESLLKKLTHPLVQPLLKPILPEIYRYVPRFRAMKQEREQGGDLILRGASAVLFIHGPAGSNYGTEDANLAYQNASLMAESLGISQFYTGFVLRALKMGKAERLTRVLGLPEGDVIRAGMGMGVPAFLFPNYIDRKEAVIRQV